MPGAGPEGPGRGRWVRSSASAAGLWGPGWDFAQVSLPAEATDPAFSPGLSS